MRQLIDQGGRFVLIGLLSTLVHYLVIVALVDGLHWLPPTPSTVAGSVLGIAIAYLGNYHYVFMPDDRRHTVYAPRFVLTYLVVMLIHAGTMHLCADRLGLPYTVGFVTATLLSAVTTFLANRYLVFSLAAGSAGDGCAGR